MRKSKKRVIAIITCCIVLATFCVGVFAYEVDSSATIDPAADRVGTIVGSTPFDMGELLVNFDNVSSYTLNPGYYIMKCDISSFPNNSFSLLYNNNSSDYSVYISYTNNRLNVRPVSGVSNLVYIYDIGDSYVYIYVPNILTINKTSEYDSSVVSLSIYSISNRSVIDSVYSNSQDVHSSLVSVINEATNVITTNDVVMMFCILIPVISFGVGILIRLRKKS